MEEIIDHRNWFQRNWKWVVPTGGCLLLIVLFVVFVGSLFFGITSLMEDSDPYKMAISRAQSNEQLIEELGEPIEKNGMMQGNINYENGKSFSDLKIPIKGPKGEALLEVIAEKRSETWEYQLMEVTVNANNQKISLLPETNLLDQ